MKQVMLFLFTAIVTSNALARTMAMEVHYLHVTFLSIEDTSKTHCKWTTLKLGGKSHTPKITISESDIAGYASCNAPLNGPPLGQFKETGNYLVNVSLERGGLTLENSEVFTVCVSKQGTNLIPYLCSDAYNIIK